MVSKSFDINTTSLQPFESTSKRLLIEVSPELVSVVLWDSQKRAPEAAEIFTGPHGNTEDWESMLQQSRLLGFSDLETQVIIAYPDMLPIPASLYEQHSAKVQLELFFGEKPGLFTRGDVLDKEEMVIAWQMPANGYEFLGKHLKFFQVKHIVSQLISSKEPDALASGQIVIYGNMCWVLLWLEGKLQIAKSIAFTVPDDLSWHLLNLCRQFEVAPTSVAWKVSGMAEGNSPLWQAITRFIDPVETMDAKVHVPEELPGHYFAHLFVTL